MLRKTTPAWLALFGASKQAHLRLTVAIFALTCAILIGGSVLAALANQAAGRTRHDAPASIDTSALTREAIDLPLEQADPPI